MLTRLGKVNFSVPQVREGGFYPSALERGCRSERAMNLALAEMYVQGIRSPLATSVSRAQDDHGAAKVGRPRDLDQLDSG